MLKHLTITALAAAVALSVPAISPASAGFRGAHFGHARNFGHAPRFAPRNHFATRGYFAHRFRTAHLPGPHHPPQHWWHWRHHSHGGYGPGYYGGYGAYGDATPVSGGTCSCLSKTYLEDGTVVFTDRCTHESAAAAPVPPSPRG